VRKSLAEVTGFGREAAGSLRLLLVIIRLLLSKEVGAGMNLKSSIYFSKRPLFE